MNIKKSIAIIAAFTISLTTLLNTIQASSADIVDTGNCGDLKWSLDSDGVLTFTGEGEMDSPDENKLDSSNFNFLNPQLEDFQDIYTYKKYAENIKEVVINEGATSIGFCAFCKMPNLESVTLPSSINKYKGYGFLKTPNINSGVKPDTFASYSFAYCQSLKNLVLKDGITAIGSFAFYGCTSLESVTIPSSIKTWEPFSFAKCENLKNIILTDELTNIGAYAFSETAVDCIFIPMSIKFSNNTSTDFVIREINEDNESNGKIANQYVNGAFNNCEKLSSVIFEDGIEDISFASFHNCPLLKKITIPSSVTKMKYAFAGCTSLEEAYIENGVQLPAINGRNDNFDGSFSGCENLKILEVPEGIELGYTNAGWNNNCNSLEALYLYGMSYRSAAIPLCNDFFKFHCYTDSSIYSSTSIPNDRKVNIEETISSTWNNFKNTVNKAEGLNESDYTPESYQALKDALEEAKKFNESTTSILPMKWASEDITTAINNLVAYDANYTSVDEAIAKADKLDLSKYTDESVKALQDAINAVKKDLDITDQDKVDAFAKAIENAIKGLVVKKTDSKPNNSETSKNPNVKPATSVSITTRSPSQVAKDKKNAENKINQAKITNLKAKSKSKKKITVSWKKVKKAVGYEVQVSKTRKFKKALFDKFTTKKKITFKKKLKSGKIYYVRVRAYATYKDAYGKPQKVYSKWIKKVRKVKVK